MFVFNNLALANRNLPDIIWCFVNRTRLANSRIDVSVQQCDIAPSASWLRLHSSSSRAMPSMECRGAVSVGTFVGSTHPCAATPVKKFLRRFEGVPGSARPIFPGRTQQGKPTSGGRIILSDKAKGVSL